MTSIFLVEWELRPSLGRRSFGANLVAEREYYRKKRLQGLQQVINKLCKKGRPGRLCGLLRVENTCSWFSAFLLKCSETLEGMERPAQTGLAKDTTGGNEGRAPGWLAAHHETAPHLMVSVWFRRRGADTWETQRG